MMEDMYLKGWNMSMTNKYTVLYSEVKHDFIKGIQMVPWDSGDTKKWLSKRSVFFIPNVSEIPSKTWPDTLMTHRFSE